MMSNVSFVIPVLDGELTISSCIKSIQDLSYPSELIEVIVVDNGSTDRTAEIVRSFGNVLLISEPQRGRSRARNAGWRAASNELIAFVDCDVILEKQWLRFILKQFHSSKVACAQGKIIPKSHTYPMGVFEKFREYNKLANTNNSMIETVLMHEFFPIINTASCLYRKDVLQELGGFDTDLERCEDSDLSLRVSRAGHLVSFSDMAISYVFWDKGGFFSYFKRELSHAYYFIRLKRKFLNKRNSIRRNLKNLRFALVDILTKNADSWLILIRLFFKTNFYLTLAFFDKWLPLMPLNLIGPAVPVFQLDFSDSEIHNMIRKTIAKASGLEDANSIKSISSHPATRIVISNNNLYIQNIDLGQYLTISGEQYYFLCSFFLDDENFLRMAGIDNYRFNLLTLIPILVSNGIIEIQINPNNVCLNPFITVKKIVDDSDQFAGFSISGGRSFRGNEEIEILKSISYQEPLFNYLNNQLSKEDWFDSVTAGLSSSTLNLLNGQQLIVDKMPIVQLLELSFDVEKFMNESDHWKRNKILRVPDDLSLSSKVREQLNGSVDKFVIFKSHLKQLNNLISLSESIIWTEPWSFNHPMPAYISKELKEKLLSFKLTDWSEQQLKDLLDVGILYSKQLGEPFLDCEKLSDQFKATQAFCVTDISSSYVTWSMGQFLRNYFHTNLVKEGDFQCADRKAVYDSPLCLHVQEGMSKLINKILPFKVRSSFNYSVYYFENADLYPHKDRIEAPYSMSYTLAAYEGEKRSDYQSTLGLLDDQGHKTELKLADGDIAFFNGFELTHYRYPIAENQSLYVIVMHFVKDDFTGLIG